MKMNEKHFEIQLQFEFPPNKLRIKFGNCKIIPNIFEEILESQLPHRTASKYI